MPSARRDSETSAREKGQSTNLASAETPILAKIVGNQIILS